MKITIGVVQKPFGIKGELKIKPMTDFVDERFKVGNVVTLLLDQKELKYEIESVRNHQGSLLVKFKEVQSLNDVEHFHQARIQIERNELHDLQEDEYYFIDLVGCDVYVNQDKLGNVTEVLDMPAHPVLRVERMDMDDVLIPFIETFIESVDLKTQRIDAIYMEGLF